MTSPPLPRARRFLLHLAAVLACGSVLLATPACDNERGEVTQQECERQDGVWSGQYCFCYTSQCCNALGPAVNLTCH
jgi:hypothetical protein